MNSIFTIKPYWHNGTWVFDDESVGLVKEPFVAGIPEMIDHAVKGIKGAASGFRMLFSASEFPGYQLKLDWTGGNTEGNWYRCDEIGMEGWLCPALFKYFPKAPKTLYIKAGSITGEHASNMKVVYAEKAVRAFCEAKGLPGMIHPNNVQDLIECLCIMMDMRDIPDKEGVVKAGMEAYYRGL